MAHRSPRPPITAHRRSVSRWLAACATVLTVAVAGACVPETPAPVPPGSDLPADVKLMTDAQAATAFELLSDEVLAGYQKPETQADIPPDLKPEVDRILGLLSTKEGRAALVPEFRDATSKITRGLPTRNETIDLGAVGATAGSATAIFSVPGVSGTRVPPPTGANAQTGASVNVGAPTATACRAPGGTGTVPAPASTVAGQLLTPQHDVYTRTSSDIVIGQNGPLSAAGVEPIQGEGPGITLRAGNLRTQQMLVRVNLEDPKRFGPAALYPLLNIKPIGGGAASEFRATITDPHIYCYAGDTRTDRGYFEGWVTIPRGEPGFQLIAEVVDNDWYFSNVQPDILGAVGPQYFAGADRATIHAGAAPLVSSAALPASVGAFATGAADPGTGVSNVLTDTNGEGSDDLEGPIRAYLDSTIRSKVNGVLSGDLLQIYIATVQAWLNKPLETSLDVKFTTPHDGFTVADEPVGSTGALKINGTVKAEAGTYIQVLGVPCTSITAKVTATLSANVWGDAVGTGTGINPRIAYNLSSDVNLDMPRLAWLDPTCVIARGLDALAIGEHFIEDGVEDGLNSTFTTTIKWQCAIDRTIFNANGTLVNPSAGIPEACLQVGSLQKLLQGFDMNAYLPTVSLGSANIHPVITDLDNSWCLATGAPAGCNDNQDLIGKDGVGVVADTALVASLGQALGGNLEGRFRNVFSPSTSSSVADLTTGHRDANQTLAGLGIVIDPRLVNLTLRHLTQGSSTSRTTNGLLDVSNLALPVGGWSLSARPEVAPEVLGVATPDPVFCDGNCAPSPYPSPPSKQSATMVVPDLRVDLNTVAGAPIKFSLSTTLDAGAEFNPSTKKLRPRITSPNVDFQVIGGCQANYTSAYALSYNMCGRGAGGNGAFNTAGAPITLTDVIGFVVDRVVLPMVDDSIGGISLLSLDGIVPGLAVSLDNVRFQQRGGFLAVYSDLRPTPRVSVVPSTELIGGVDYLRFFPSLQNINTAIPTTYTWEVKDGNSGLVVPTAPYPFAPTSAVYVPVTSFLTADTNFGPGKKAVAKLTVRQANLEVSATAEVPWYPPAPPPNNPCIPSGPGFLKAVTQDGAAGATSPSAVASAIGC